MEFLGCYAVFSVFSKEFVGLAGTQILGNLGGFHTYLISEPNFTIFEAFSTTPVVHRGRSDTAASANADSDAPQKFASEILAVKSQRNSCELSVAKEFASECE